MLAHGFSVQFSRSVMSDSLQPCELQHVRLPIPLPTPGACSNSYTLSWGCDSTISSSVIPFSSCLQSFSESGFFFFSNESILCIRWPKDWSFSFNISPSNEYSGLISFRMDWLDLLAVQGTLTRLLQHHSSKHQFFGARVSLYSTYLVLCELSESDLNICFLLQVKEVYSHYFFK